MLFKSLSVTKLGDINNGKEDEEKITKLPFINEFFFKKKNKKKASCNSNLGCHIFQ